MNIQTTETTHNVTLAIDELGRLQARIADLRAQEERLKDILKSLGDGAYEGELFRAVVASTERSTLDMKAVREKLSPQWIRCHTNVTPVTTLKVTARKAS